MGATLIRTANTTVGLLAVGLMAVGCAKRTTIAAVLDEVKPGWTESMVKNHFPDMSIDKRPIVDEVSVVSLNGGGIARKVWGDSF